MKLLFGGTQKQIPACSPGELVWPCHHAITLQSAQEDCAVLLSSSCLSAYCHVYVVSTKCLSYFFFFFNIETTLQGTYHIPILKIRKLKLRKVRRSHWLIAWQLVQPDSTGTLSLQCPCSIPRASLPLPSLQHFSLCSHTNSFLTNKPRGLFCYPQLPFCKWKLEGQWDSGICPRSCRWLAVTAARSYSRSYPMSGARWQGGVHISASLYQLLTTW